MSKLLAMMTKKQEYMNLEVVGNPTIVDGVVSGFSASNYLNISQPFVLNQNTFAEFKFKITTGEVNVANGFIATKNSYGLSFIVGSNSILRLYIGDGNSWSILNQIGVTVLSSNSDYFIKLIFNNGNVKVLLSDNDITYSTEINENITINEELTYNLSLGTGRALSTQYFRGSIDIYNSYEKLGNTKYIFTLP